MDGEAWFYLKPLYLAEVGVARALGKLRLGPHPLPAIDTEAALHWVENKIALELAESQRDAVRQATRQKVLVITGGPGVGKTTIVRGILEIFAAKNQRWLGEPNQFQMKRVNVGWRSLELGREQR